MVAFQIHQHKPGGVPELVAEVATELEPLGKHQTAGQGFVLGPGGPLGGKVLFAMGTGNPRQRAVFARLRHRLAAMRALELHWHADVLRFGAQVGQGEPQRIGAKLLNHIDRIDAVPLALGHGFPVPVQDLRVDIDFAERHLAHVVQPGKHHSGHPQRDDVAAGDERAGGIVVLQLGRLFRPAQRGMGPQRGAEPRVQHVLFLAEFVAGDGVFGQVFVSGADEKLLALLVPVPGHVVASGESALEFLFADRGRIPDGNPVPPPELAADRPVPFLAQPGQVAAGVPLRDDFHPAVGYGVHRRLGQLVHPHEPLVGQSRLDGGFGPVGMGQVDHPLFDLFDQPLAFQVFDHATAGLGDGKPLVPAGVFVQRAVGIQNVDHGQLLPQAHFVVVRVVARGDLDRPGAHLRLSPGVQNQRDGPLLQRQHHLAAGGGHVAQFQQ